MASFLCGPLWGWELRVAAGPQLAQAPEPPTWEGATVPPPPSPSLLPSHSSSLPFFLKLCGALREEADQINIFIGSSQNSSFLHFHFVFRDHKLGLSTAGCDLLEPPAHCGRFHKQSCFVCCTGKNRIISFNGTSGRL